MRGVRSEAWEGAQERRDGGSQCWCKGTGVWGVWVSQCSTATFARLEQGCASLSGESGVDGEDGGGVGGKGKGGGGGVQKRSEVQCCRAALASLND